MTKPTTVILDSEEAIKQFHERASLMRVCEFDIEEVVQTVFRDISGDPHQKVDVPYADTVEDLEEDDRMLLNSAVSRLSHTLQNECKRLGMYDEQGRLGFTPTGWVGSGSIVLTSDELEYQLDRWFTR
jgi:hypothetical protein